VKVEKNKKGGLGPGLVARIGREDSALLPEELLGHPSRTVA